MGFSDFKNNPITKTLTNKYVLILLTFLVWMFFFDENSYFAHKKFNTEINELESTIHFYKTKIAKDKLKIQQLQDSLQLERFAREQYLMKKEKEDIYIIEFDTIKK